MALNDTKLDGKIIKQILEQEYGIKVLSIRKMIGGSANLYKIKSKNGKEYVLKEFQNGIEESKVLKEISITNYLRSNGFPTSNFIVPTNKIPITYNENNILTLQEYIEGYTLPYFSSSTSQCLDAAKVYSKIVELLNEYPLELPKFNMKIFNIKQIEEKISKCETLIKNCSNNDITSALYEKMKMLEKMMNFDFSILNGITILNGHGDYNSSQFIYDKDGKIKAVIDFASAKKLPIAWELIRSFVFMDSTYCHGKFNVDALIIYLKYFNEQHCLNSYDLKNMCLLYYVYLINSLFGFEQFISNHNQNYYRIGMNLHEQSKYIDKNINSIEKQLLKRKGEIL